MIKQLEWDTDFFGYKVGHAIIGSDDININDELLKEANNFKLVYLISDKEIKTEIEKLYLVDIKTTLVKEPLIKEKCIELKIVENTEGNEEQLKNLALQSGIYSRFKKDSNFKNNEFEKLYLKWITDSINKKIADTVLIYVENDVCKGFITLKYKENYAEIGLIAIEEHSRGKGIGLSLLCTVNNLTKDKGLTGIHVTTQFENIPAMKLYKKAGYKIVSKKYVYHLWN